MHLTTFKIVVFISYLHFSLFAFSQTDSNSVIELHNSAYNLELSNPDSAIYLYDSAAGISNAVHYLIGQGRSYNYKAIVLFEQGKYLEAKETNLKAIPIFDSINYQTGIAACIINLGNIELYLSNYEQAMQLYLKGTKIYEILNDTTRLIKSFNNISSLFLNNHQAKKAIEYSENACKLSILTFDSTSLSDSYINLANAYFILEDTLKFIKYSKEAAIISNHAGDLYNLILASNNIANYFLQKRLYDSAYFYALKTLKLAKQYKNPFNIAQAYIVLAKAAYNKKAYSKSKLFLNEAFKIIEDYKLESLHLKLHYQQYLLDNALGNYKKANLHLGNYVQLKDSINKLETQKYIHLLEQKFENNKKEILIETQKASIKDQKEIIERNNLLFFTGIIIICLIIAMLILLIRNVRHRKRMHSEHLKRLKAEQEAKTVHALIEGQEQERKRIASELHDGINGSLAGIKLFAAINRKQEESFEAFKEIENLLGNLSDEVRELSHNIMPGALTRGSLKNSIEEFIQRLNHSNKIEFEFQCIGNIEPANENTKIYIYRILQEVLENVLKHSNASECIVQFSNQKNLISICVEDNGIGFEPIPNNYVSNKSGIGMKSINSRVEYLNGNIEIQSEINQGTAVFINIPN